MGEPLSNLRLVNQNLLGLFILGLPLAKSLIFAWISRSLLFCLLTFLFLFLVRHSDDIAQAIRRCILAIRSGIRVPESRRSDRVYFFLPLPIRDRFLSPFMMRPPPDLLAYYL